MQALIGQELEDFKVQAYHNGSFKEITRDNVLGKWSVFFFYPADFTFVCPTELGDVADHYDEFQKLNCEIYSVSSDSHFVHKAWADASDTIKKIQYPMLADPVFTLSRFFGVLVEESGQALSRYLYRQSRRYHQSLRSARHGHWPQCRRAAPQSAGSTIRGGSWRSGMPGQMEARRRHPHPQPKPDRQIMI